MRGRPKKWSEELDQELIELIRKAVAQDKHFAAAFREFHARHPEFPVRGAAGRWQSVLKLNNDVRIMPKETSNKKTLMFFVKRIFGIK